MAATSTSTRTWRAEITALQWIVLVATTLGWALDGFDLNLFSLIVGPATTDLLHNAPAARVHVYSGLAVTIFLTGWALGAVIFGVLADYVGRKRVLIIGVLTYAVFTGLAALSTQYWQLAVLRFLAGIGSGVELPIGAALVAEAWTNRYRAKATGIMMSGLGLGFFLASVVYNFVGHYGWRATMAVGLVPAVLVFFVQRYVREPEAMAAVKSERARRKQARRAGARKVAADRFVLVQLFSPPLLRRTLPCTIITAGALFAFWSVTTWTPQIVRDVVAANGVTGAAAIPLVSRATALLNLGGVVGYAAWGFIADKIGRKRTYLVSLAAAIISVGVLYPFAHSYTMYLVLLPVVGFGVFSMFSGNSVYFAELFGPAVRASAIAVTNSIGRLATAAGPLVAGVIAAQWFGGSLPLATTAVSLLIVIALFGLPFTPESHGAFLYAEDEPTAREDTPPPVTA